MLIRQPEKRLEKFWGKVDKKHIQCLIPFIKGSRVLDIGSGYGSTTAFISSLNKYQCTGIDNDPKNIEIAKKRYPDCNFILMDARSLNFKHKFDTIILRDVLHHLYNEYDFSRISEEIKRISHKDTRIIILEPNITFFLKMLRKLSFHTDPECSYKKTSILLQNMGFSVKKIVFNTVISLALSGGYVGINFVPDIKFIYNIILNFEYFIEKFLAKIKLDKFICVRYLIVADKKEN